MTTTIPYAQFVGSDDPLTILPATPARIDKACTLLRNEQLTASPAPGKWSIHQIVAHLADTEMVFQTRVRLMVFGDNPTLAGYDQDRWMEGWLRESEPFSSTLERFRVLRECTVRLFTSTPEAELNRTGLHTERGTEKAGNYRIILAGHDLNHLPQIEGIAAKVQS